VEGDGQQGTIVGGYENQVVSGYTNPDGQLSAIFTSGLESGAAGISAELIYNEGGGPTVVRHDRKVIYVGIKFIHLPLIRR